jgi:phosphatidate cytidylyltransferase
MEPLETSTETPAESGTGNWSGLGTRTLSAVALGIVAFICVWSGGMIYTSLIVLAALLMKKEWDGLVPDPSTRSRITGYVYVILPCASLLWMRALPGETGIAVTVALIAVISATDIGAYFVGRRFGKHKLAPVMSPNKTWEGLGGGFFSAIFVALLVSSYVPLPHSFVGTVWTGGLIALLAQGGDLYESSLKRKAGVKDSGAILPGHGGLLDRFDGYMFAAPVFALLVHCALKAVIT